MSRVPPDWLKKRTPCPFYPTGRCVFADKCNFIHDGEVSRKQHRMRGQVPAYRRTPENSVDSFSSSEEDQVVQEPHIDEHSAAAPSLVFSSIYGGRPNSINRLGLDVDLPVSPESLPNSPPRRPTSHHSSHGHINITSPTPSRPLSAALGIGIGGRAQGLAEVFTAVATAQAQATALPPSTAGSLPSPLSLSPKSPPPDAQELVIKDDNFTLEQFPFKLALSNQSSLLLNRTTRAAARRGSSLPQRSGSSSSATPDKTKKPTNLSAPERFSVGSVPRRVGDDEESLDRPGSHSRSVSGSSLLEEEEEQADDEDEDEDEDEPQIINEPPSLEALQPYPRDVSNEPSPEPTARQFVTPIPPPPPPPAQEERQPMPRRYTVRSNSDRHIGHEALLDELEERLGVEPRRKRARSGGAAQLLEQAQNLPTQPTPSSAPAPEPRRSSMGKAVDMDAARNMLTAMFAKRAVQEDVTPSSDEQEVEQDQSFLPADWDVGSLVFGTSEMDESEAGDAPRSVSRGVRDVVPVDVYDPIPTTARNSISSNRNTIPTDIHDTIPTNVHETTHAHEDDTTDTDSYSGDSDDEPTEELADIINEQAVLSTPIVLRREVPRETSLPSRTGSGFGTPRTTTLNTPTSGTPRNLTLSGSPGAVQVESVTGENVESNARTQTMASDPRPASEPTSKSRPRSQLKPLRLSRMYGLGAPATPVSANTATPTPTHPYTAVSPTPTATGMYPTPSSAHPMQLPMSLRSVSSRSGAEEDAGAEEEEEPVSGGRAESVSWFGSKKGSKQASLSASMRDSVRRSVHSPAASAQTTSVPSPTRQRRIVTPPKFTAPEEDEEDVRPLPMVWDDDEISVRSGSVRQRTQSSRSASLSVPAFEVPAEEPTANASSPPKTPNQLPPQTPNGLPPRTPDRLGSMHRYPAFVHLGAASPRVSEGRRTPLVSPSTRSFVSSAPESKAPSVRTSRAPSVRTSRAPSLQESQAPSVQESKAPSVQESKAPSELESKAEPEPRSRKWADTINQDSIGSLPAFDAPAQAQPTEAQPTDAQPTDAQPADAPRSRRPKQRYMQIPNTAPLSISPRRVSPSLMQQSQDEALESYEEDMYPRDDRVPHTAPLHLRLRMAREEGSPTPWMAEYFTNSPSSLHSSQMGRGSMHSNSSSVSTGVKVAPARRSIVVDKQINAPIDEQPEAFGNPGPGPSTMKTFTERRQSAGTLGSPIVLQSPRQERAPTVQEPVPSEPASRRTSRQPSMDATPREPEEPRVEISSEEVMTEVNSTPRSAAPSLASQSPLRTRTQLQTSPTIQRHMTMASSPGRQPPTPMTAPSPLQILRRNMMARTSPESPRFLSPQTRLTNLPESRPSRHQHHASLAPTPTMQREELLRNMPMSAPGPRDRRSLTPSVRFTPMPSRPGSPTQSVQSTLSQTKPLLFFAIAKNSAQEVERLLQVGEAQPDDKAGPDDLPALAFALANEQLTDKTQIVKSLLSHGADPSSVLHRKTGSGEFDDNDLALTTRIEQGMNPAIRYYLNRKRMTIPAPQAELLEKNKFGGLTRAGYGIIGQDAALDELIRVVAGHCRRQTLNPLVIVFSGGPGCGKSLLASKIGPLLHVPTFTVNMTNLRNEAALFNYISMTTKAGNPQIPLVDFLRHNEAQRCVVVLEEIEKAADKTVWHSLLMPWEWGKATVIAPGTNEQIDIDTSQVIWIATSNSGDDATLKFFAERSRPSGAIGYDRGDSALARLAQGPRPNDNFTRKDYLQLMQAVRKRLGELLGSSMISRVSSVLPFLPFTEEEVYALASESLSAMRADQKADQSAEDVDWEELLQQAVGEYIPGEGARSVHRAVQRAFDEITEW